VIPIRLPSLRERAQDIRALALHFLNRANQDNQRNVSLSPDALTQLEQHTWVGNIRELGNVIERLVLLTDSTMVHTKELLRYLPAGTRERPEEQLPRAQAATQAALSAKTPSSPLVRDYQTVQSHSAVQLRQALQANGGNQSRAAQAVGLTARQFGYRLRKLGF
jgi:Nif-specific regulatory protein